MRVLTSSIQIGLAILVSLNTVTSLASVTSCQVQRERLISIRGCVLERPDGKGIGGVNVRLRSDWDRRYSPVAVTDAQGFFVFEDVDPGPYSVSLVEHPVGIWTAGTSTTVYVAEDPDGTRAGKTQLIRMGQRDSFRLAEVGTGPGQYKVSKKRAGDAYEVTVITNCNQQRQRVELSQELPQSVSGRILDTVTEEPVPGAGIRINKPRGQLKSDTEGRYRIFIHPCELDLWSNGTKDRYYLGPDRRVEVRQGEHLTGVDLHVKSAPAVAGQVVVADGSVSGAGIDVWLIFAWRDKLTRKGRIPGGQIYNSDTIQHLKTDRNGRFTGYFRRPERWDQLDRFDVSITACALTGDGSLGGFVRTDIIEPDVVSIEPLTIMLHKTGTAEIRVTDPEDVGVSDANIIGYQYHIGYQYNEGTPLQPFVLIKQIGDGRYLIKGLIQDLAFVPFVQSPGFRQEFPYHKNTIVAGKGEHVIKLKWKGEKEVDDLARDIWPQDEGIPYRLGLIGPGAREAVPALVKLLRRPTDETTLFRAAKALSKAGLTTESEAKKLFGPTNDTVLFRTAEALGNIGVASRPVKSALIELVKTRRHRVANAAARSLGQLRAKEALDPIETALKEGRIDGRFALPALWRIKKASKVDMDAKGASGKHQ